MSHSQLQDQLLHAGQSLRGNKATTGKEGSRTSWFLSTNSRITYVGCWGHRMPIRLLQLIFTTLSGGPFSWPRLPKQWTRENFMAWLKTGRIKVSFLRFKIRDYVEIMHKLRALDLTSENLSQNLISAITCTIRGSRVLDESFYLPCSLGLEQFWTVRL